MPGRDAFFIGWAAPPAALRRFLATCALGLIAFFAAVAYLVAATAPDPGDGAFRFDFGEQVVTGWLEADPYPMLHVTASARFPAGHTLMLSGVGKTGVQPFGAPLDGQLARATGIVLKRGALDMLQVKSGAEGLVKAEGSAAPALVAAPLGRWRLTGEICDGKCYAGAMRPGGGIAHKACANLCVTGGVPPVFVSTGPVEGTVFFLLGAAAGGPVGAEVLDWTAALIEAEGDVELRGDLLVFRVDPATIRLAR